MMITEAEILKTLDEALFLPFTNSPIKKPVESSPNRIYVTVQNPAVPIAVEDYQNVWSPGKLDYDAIATKRFSDWVDAVPALAPTHCLNGHRISELYAQILGAIANSSIPERSSQSYQDAESFLYDTIATKDDETGQVTIKKVESDLYHRYKEAKARYLNALAAYQSQYVSYIKTPEGKRMWSLVSSGFYAPVEVAWQQFRSTEATQVEDALGTLDRMAIAQVPTLFREANQQYLGYQLSDPTNLAESFAPSYPMPSNWAEAEGWTELELSFKQTQVKSSGQSLAANAIVLKIRFQFKVVRLERPWFRFDLFSLPNWSVKSVAPGTYAKGTRTQQEQSLLPLLPQAFIAVRNLEASGSWSEEEVAQIQRAIGGSDTAVFARFLLNGTYTRQGKVTQYKATFDRETLTFPGIHIVGWVNRLVPFSPPKI